MINTSSSINYYYYYEHYYHHQLCYYYKPIILRKDDLYICALKLCWPVYSKLQRIMFTPLNYHILVPMSYPRIWICIRWSWLVPGDISGCQLGSWVPPTDHSAWEIIHHDCCDVMSDKIVPWNNYTDDFIGNRNRFYVIDVGDCVTGGNRDRVYVINVGDCVTGTQPLEIHM